MLKDNALFQNYIELIELHEKIDINLTKSFFKDKACFIFDRSIASDIKAKLEENFASSRFVSFLADGFTDKGIFEEEFVYLQYEKSCCLYTEFAGIKYPAKVDAKGIFDVISEVLFVLKCKKKY